MFLEKVEKDFQVFFVFFFVKTLQNFKTKEKRETTCHSEQIPSHPPDATMIPGAESLLAMFPDV